MNGAPDLPAPTADEASGTPATARESESDALFATLYGDLHRLARREAARSGTGIAAVGATTLVHEAYLDISQRAALDFPDRARFLAYAARAMRNIVIDRVRAGGAQKRGGDLDITSLDTQTPESIAEPAALSDLGAALDELGAIEPELAHVVDLKFFCGFGFAEIASLQGISERTVQRQWEKARLLLHRALSDTP